MKLLCVHIILFLDKIYRQHNLQYHISRGTNLSHLVSLTSHWIKRLIRRFFCFLASICSFPIYQTYFFLFFSFLLFSLQRFSSAEDSTLSMTFFFQLYLIFIFFLFFSFLLIFYSILSLLDMMIKSPFLLSSLMALKPYLIM